VSGGGFVKVVPALWHGTLYGQADAQLVFLFLLAHAGANGQVDVTPLFIEGSTGIPLDRVRAALLFLEAEDPDSRSPDEGGRRIVRLDEHRSWGWRLVNHARYRWTRDPDARREQTREAMRRARGGEYINGPGVIEDPDGTATTCNSCEPSVSVCEPKQKQKQKQKQREATSSSLRSEDGVTGERNPESQRDEKPEDAGKLSGFEQGALEGIGTPSEASEVPRGVPRASSEVCPLPIVGGGSWQASEGHVSLWRKAYPAVDLPREFARMAAWLASNAKNLKTGRGVAAFANSWLAGEQDRGGRGVGGRAGRAGVRTGADARYLEANGGDNGTR